MSHLALTARVRPLGLVLFVVMVASWCATAKGAPPSNDTCATATPLVLGVPVQATNQDAASDLAESTCGFNDSHDVWFTFTSTEFANFRVRTYPASAIDTTIAVFSGCGGALLACNDDSPDIARGEHWSRVDLQISPNQTIKVRVAGWNGAAGSFIVGIDYVPVFHPANDDCALATPLSLGIPTNTTTVGCTGTDITSCGEDDFNDAWYSFVAPTDGTFEFTPTNTDIFGLFFAAFPSCGGAEMACGLRDLSIPMTAGQSIVVRAAFIGGVAGDFTMNIGPATPPPVPPNDDCEGAITLAGTGSFPGTTIGASGYDTGNIFGCTLTDTGPGVWYRFVAPAPGIYDIDTNRSPGLDDTVLVLFGSCNSAGGTELSGCDDNLGEGLHSRVLWQAADAGDAVYIVVAGQHHSAGEFQLNISQNLVPPANDRCSNAIPITSPSMTRGDNFLAENIDISASVCDDGLFPLFYSFVAPADATYLFDVLESPDLPYAGVAIFDACAGNELACGPDRAVRLAMVAGQSVIVRVSGQLYYRGPFMLRVGTEEPGPANDRCESAASLAFGVAVHATNRGATGSITTEHCASTEATDPMDVWYTFTAPASGSYSFAATGFIRPGISIFPGCWPQTSAIACADGCQGESQLTVPLDAGQLVNIRVTPCFVGYGGRTEAGAFTLSVGSEALGACCSGSTCRIDTAPACGNANERFAGAGLACGSNPAPCCRADFNQNGQVGVQDIFDFLNAWFAGDPAADFNGGGLSVQDIFDFLNAWFAGC